MVAGCDPSSTLGGGHADERFWSASRLRVPKFPTLAISLTVLGLNLLDDAIRDTVDPRLRGAVR